MRVYLLLTAFALLVGAAIVMANGPVQNHPAPGQQRKEDRAEFESQFPLTDINKPKPPTRLNKPGGRPRVKDIEASGYLSPRRLS